MTKIKTIFKNEQFTKKQKYGKANNDTCIMTYSLIHIIYISNMLIIKHL